MAKSEILGVLKKHSDFVITSHVNPDGDAMGSSLALALVLREAGKNVTVVLRGFQKKMAKLMGMERVVQEYVAQAQKPVLICLDTATAERALVGGFEQFAETINIDHHISNTNYAKYNLVDANCAAACEVLLHLISGEYEITKPVAELLLMGLLRDTGGLRNANTSAETLRSVMKLLEYGVDIAEVSQKYVNCRTVAETRIFARALDKMQILYGGKIAVTVLTVEDYKRAEASHEDNEGIAEHMREIDSVLIAMLVTERENGVKINFRSVGASVLNIAAKFGGGGHKYAAGAPLLEGNVLDIVDSAVTFAREEIERYEKEE